MKIVILTTFLEGTTKYTKGDSVTVSEEDGIKFCALGWAHKADSTATQVESPANVTLNIQDSFLGISDNLR